MTPASIIRAVAIAVAATLIAQAIIARVPAIRRMLEG